MTAPDQPATPRDLTRIDPDALRFGDQYKLMTGTIVPRPIALVTTLGPDGGNAAPFSFFNAVGAKPPMIVFSAGPRFGEVKDTIYNLERLPEFVLHIVDFASAEKMNLCAMEFPRHVDEIERAGWRTAPSEKVKPVRLIDCPVQMECKVVDIRKIGRAPYDLVLGEIVLFHFHEGIVNERLHVDHARLDAIGRLAGDLNYIRTRERFGMAIPPVPESDLAP